MITDWRKLEVGKHYRLSCGCHGFVEKLDLEPSEHSKSTGFRMLYTTGLGCSGGSLEKSYREGYGPYTNFFNYSLAEEAMPAEEVEVPAWWPEVKKCFEMKQMITSINARRFDQ